MRERTERDASSALILLNYFVVSIFLCTFATMKRILLLTFTLVMSLSVAAQYDFLKAHRGVIKGGYDFWVYTPEDYYYSQEHTPVIIFLHGASLCGRDINRSRRYGPLDAIVRGREIPALVIFLRWSLFPRILVVPGIPRRCSTCWSGRVSTILATRHVSMCWECRWEAMVRWTS